MAVASGNSLQATILEAVRKSSGSEGKSAFTYKKVAEGVEEERKTGRPILPQEERFALRETVLAYWNDLLRCGIISFGCLDSWDINFFHLTSTGRKTLEQLGRDPINLDGYMLHLQKCATLDSVSESYIKEALNTYRAGCYKATAVMVGTAAEGMILHLRDVVVGRLRAAKKKFSKELEGWRIKAVCDELATVLEAKQKDMGADLSGAYDTYWCGFTSHIRAIRNKSGHPNSIDPVSAESVHAALLIFPEFAQLVGALEKWAASHHCFESP